MALGTTAILLRWDPWQPAVMIRKKISRNAAERGRGRAGECANSVNRPLARFGEHPNELAEDFVVYVIQLIEVILLQVPAAKRELQPDASFLGFAFRIAQFTNKMSFISALPPGFADIAHTDREERRI